MYKFWVSEVKTFYLFQFSGELDACGEDILRGGLELGLVAFCGDVEARRQCHRIIICLHKVGRMREEDYL